MPGGTPERSRLLAALDGSDASDPIDTDEPGEAAINALKRRLEAIPDVTLAMRFGRTPNARNAHRDKRPRYSHAANANPIALLEREVPFGSTLTTGLTPARSRRGPAPDDEPPVQAPAGSTLYDFALNYDTETPVRPMDIGGSDQEQQMKDFVHRTLDDMNHGRSIKEALDLLGLSDLEDIIPGMNITLMPHQVVGVSWMVDQELKSPHKGGILGDDMGLGKTVQMIALMAINGPKVDSRARQTLIVVPAALVQQWKDELESKANGMFDVHIHHGPQKLKNVKDIKEKDVIITTYHTLNADCRIPESVEETDEIRWVQKHGGVLSRTSWHRVVLDEAQFIRNRKTQSSRAVAMLDATYRWCLTGTPITNTLADVYGLIRFGKFRPWNDWREFDKQIASQMANNVDVAGMRTREVLNRLMIRRTKTTKAEDGTPLVKLPPKDVELVELEFSKPEREIYDAFEKKMRIKINKFIRRGTLLKNSTVVLVMILRLRQLSCHPFLIISLDGDASDPDLIVGGDADKELARAKRIMPAKWIKEVLANFLLKAQAERVDFPEGTKIPDSQCPVCYEAMTPDSGRVLECTHEVCFDCMLDISKSALQVSGEVAHDDDSEKNWEVAATKGDRPCPTCKKLVSMGSEKTFRSYAFEPEEKEIEEAIRTRRTAQRARRSGKADSKRDVFMDIDDSDDEVEVVLQESLDERRKRAMAANMDSDDELPDITTLLAQATTPAKEVKKGKKKKDAEVIDDGDEDDDQDKADKADPKDQAFYDGAVKTYSHTGTNLEPSTKMVRMMELLREWEVCGDKTIVYSQWTSLLDLVDMLFTRNGIRSLRYDGKMSRDKRERTLREFRSHNGPKVICISIKCGGVGLNLVSANRVINLDLSWNYASESQAYDRVHRVGQEKAVTVKRLVIKDTLEERMLRLQGLKNDLSDVALGEGTGHKLHKLSVKEIKHLFGFNNIQDNNGK